MRKVAILGTFGLANGFGSLFPTQTAMILMDHFPLKFLIHSHHVPLEIPFEKVGIKKTTSHVTPQQRLSSHDLRIDISELVSSLGKSLKSMMFPYHMNFPRDLHRIQPWTRRGSAWLKQRPKTPFPSLAQPTTRNKNDDWGPGRDPAGVGIFLEKMMIYWWMVIIYYDYFELYDYTMII